MKIFIDDSATSELAIAYGLERMKMICAPYFLCGLMEVLTGVLVRIGTLRFADYRFRPRLLRSESYMDTHRFQVSSYADGAVCLLPRFVDNFVYSAFLGLSLRPSQNVS